jgi:hypothetical protein
MQASFEDSSSRDFGDLSDFLGPLGMNGWLTEMRELAKRDSCELKRV